MEGRVLVSAQTGPSPTDLIYVQTALTKHIIALDKKIRATLKVTQLKHKCYLNLGICHSSLIEHDTCIDRSVPRKQY